MDKYLNLKRALEEDKETSPKKQRNEDEPTTSKRALEKDNESSPKKPRTIVDAEEEMNEDKIIKRTDTDKYVKHYWIPADIIDDNELKHLFSRIIIKGYDQEHDRKKYPTEAQYKAHWHVMGVSRWNGTNKLNRHSGKTFGFFKTKDWVKPVQFMIHHHKAISSGEHWKNCYYYIKRKEKVTWNEDLTFELDPEVECPEFFAAIKKREKIIFSKKMMAIFRSEYPQQIDWLSKIYADEWSSAMIKTHYKLEAQRFEEDRTRPLDIEDYRKVAHLRLYIAWLYKMRAKWEQHPTDSGYAIIFAGKAATYKSTMCRILAGSFGKYHKWTGTQFIKEDILKYDSMVKCCIQTLIVEEMKWQSPEKRITQRTALDDLKSFLTGDGIQVRTTKTGKDPVHDVELHLTRIFLSYNPSVDNGTFEQLDTKINTTPEYARRFYHINVDEIVGEGGPLYNVLHSNIKYTREFTTIITKILMNNKNFEDFQYFLKTGYLPKVVEEDEETQYPDLDDPIWSENLSEDEEPVEEIN